MTENKRVVITGMGALSPMAMMPRQVGKMP